MADTVTLLHARPGEQLAKRWRLDGRITPAAFVMWFQASESPISGTEDFQRVLDRCESNRRIALVKEAIAPGANPNRLRRRCEAGIDKRTGEHFIAGLMATPKSWIVLDVEKVPRPKSLDYRDGDALAVHARSLLPGPFKTAACVWQLSGSSGHPTRRDEIRLHLYFMLDMAVFPSVWKPYFAAHKFIDPSAFDKAKLIFTAAPIIVGGCDPIDRRHGVLDGDSAVTVPQAIIARSDGVISGASAERPPAPVANTPPMPKAADAFVKIIAKSNILRSHDPAYQGDRSRRLTFCSQLRAGFGISDEAALAQAFRDACVGDDDPHGEHDVQQAVMWATRSSSSGRIYSVRRLLCDASKALHVAGDGATARQAAQLAMVFGKIETGL